jgi:UDP-N-acetylglucosamine/UDP-N-acetylgalactosamine diphosphorylase
VRTKLQSIGQGSVLRFFAELDPAGQKRLMRQIDALDLDHIAHLVDSQVKQKPALDLPKEINPVKAYPHKPGAEHRELYQQAEQRGLELLRQGKVGAFLVAGGQGTRLGYDGPKGEYPVTPIQNKPLFQVFAEQLAAWSREVGRVIPWYIMTSDINDGPTRAFFHKHGHFGYDPAAIFIFEQGMMPAFSLDGQMLLAEK